MKPKLENWFIARGAIIAVSAFCAAFAVYYWAGPLWDANRPLSIAVGLGFAISAAVTPCVVPKLAHAKGFALAGLAAVCVVFGTIDSVGVVGGFAGLEKDLTQAEFDAATTAYNTQRTALETEIKGYNTEIKAANAKFGKTGEITRASSLAEIVDPLRQDRDAAQQRLDALQKPVRADRFDNDLMEKLSFALQAVLAFGLLALEAARQGKFKREMAVYEAVLAERRIEREKKEKAKARSATRKPKTKTTERPERQAFKPRFVANDA